MHPKEKPTALVEFFDKAVVFGPGDLKIQSTPPRLEAPFEQSWTIFVSQDSVDEAMNKVGIEPGDYMCVLQFRSAAYFDWHQLVAKVAPGLAKLEDGGGKNFYQIFARTQGESSILGSVTVVSANKYKDELQNIQKAYRARQLPNYTK